MNNGKGAPLDDNLSIAIKLDKDYIWKPKTDSYFVAKDYRTLDGVLDTAITFHNKRCPEYLFQHGYNPCERYVSPMVFQFEHESTKAVVLNKMHAEGCY
ncbi:MAG: hypothetical protein JST12_16110 [Armatimonadetes bacterium]|nr:hypothetical protein [Armatimonadota bacterium]